MKKLGLLIILVSFIGTTSSFAQTKTTKEKHPVSIKEQTGGDAPCPCLANQKGALNTLADNQGTGPDNKQGQPQTGSQDATGKGIQK